MPTSISNLLKAIVFSLFTRLIVDLNMRSEIFVSLWRVKPIVLSGIYSEYSCVCMEYILILDGITRVSYIRIILLVCLTVYYCHWWIWTITKQQASYVLNNFAIIMTEISSKICYPSLPVSNLPKLILE